MQYQWINMLIYFVANWYASLYTRGRVPLLT